jgi:ferredoxin-type protein NapH
MKRFRTWHRLTALAFIVLLFLGAQEFFPWFKGSTTATRVFDTVPFADPLAAIEVALASGTLDETLFIGAGLLVAVGLLLGPVFCGWVCPLGLLLDLNQVIRKRVTRRPGGRLPRIVKYAVLGFALAFSLFASLPAFQIVSPINFLSWLLVFNPTESFFLSALLVLLFVEYAVPRIWCRALCPLGAFYGLIGRFAWLRIHVDPDHRCPPKCRQCSIHCPMGIAVKEEYTSRVSIDHPDCTRCGDCVEPCPKVMLRFRNFGPG